MLTLAAIQKSTLSIKFGVALDADAVQAILANPVKFDIDNDIEKFNIPMVVAPCVSKAKVFDAQKPAYLGVAPSKDGKFINITLTNVKPDNQLDTNKAVMALFTTRYDDADAKKVTTAALAELNKLYKSK